MKIEYVDKFDLYEKGNYIRSFDSYDEILDFFDSDNNYWADINCPYYRFIEHLNKSCYTVIPSKHLKFA